MGVVLEHATADGAPVLPRPAERTVGPEEAVDDRAGCPFRGVQVARGPRRVRRREGRSRIGERRDREPVPGRQRLAVTGRLWPLAAAGEEQRPGLGQPRRDLGRRDPERNGKVRVVHDPRQDRHPLPVALLGHAVRRREEVGRVAQHVPDLGGTPGEREALDAVGVGVLAGGERAVVGGQLAAHVVERPGRDREQVAGRR